jgi:peroxiredoxin
MTAEPFEPLPSSTPRRHVRAPRIFTPIAMVLLLVAGAWYIGGQEGFSKIGGGGMNLRLLPKVGDPAPDFLAYTAQDGTPVLLSSYRGTPVWLNFWGSWCPPCRAEFPDLEAAYAEVLQPAGVALLAISLDESAAAAWGYASRNGGAFTILSDHDRHDTGGAYPVSNFPTHILIDRKGIVRAVILAPYNKAELIAAAQQIIGP